MWGVMGREAISRCPWCHCTGRGGELTPGCRRCKRAPLGWCRGRCMAGRRSSSSLLRRGTGAPWGAHCCTGCLALCTIHCCILLFRVLATVPWLTKTIICLQPQVFFLPKCGRQNSIVLYGVQYTAQVPYCYEGQHVTSHELAVLSTQYLERDITQYMGEDITHYLKEDITQ